ncbi:hypothetical protein ACLB2K_065073 [Fragaria x ananassa]
MHFHFFLALIAMLLPLIVAIPERHSLAGLWQPIQNTSDPKVIELAKFAISEYNKNTTKKLAFESVVSGKFAHMSGTFYELVVAAKNESLPTPVENYGADVWVLGFYQKLKFLGLDRCEIVLLYPIIS